MLWNPNIDLCLTQDHPATPDCLALLCDEISMAQNTVANLSLEKEQFAQEMQVCAVADVMESYYPHISW